MNISEINDIAGRFDISDSEAKRIAANANNEAEFIKIWENDDWWTDGNTAKRFKAAGDALNAGIEADHGNTFIPVCLSDEGQAHVAAELKRHGIDWDVSAVCSEIEEGRGFSEMRVGSDDTYDYETQLHALACAKLAMAFLHTSKSRQQWFNLRQHND
jgi:hypothetical protein